MRSSTRLRALGVVERAVTEVHRDPARPHSLEKMAQYVGVSRYRFHHIFKELVGEPFGAYVQRTRMEYAVRMLRAAPHMSLTSAAFASGFSEQSDFSRQFKAYYGVSPRTWDRKETLKNSKKRQVTNETTAYDWSCLPDEPRHAPHDVHIRSFPAWCLAIMRVDDPTNASKLASAFGEFDAWLVANNQSKSERCILGLSYSDLFSAGESTMHFELGCPVDESVAPSDGVIVRRLPPFKAAVTHCRGGMTQFVNAWDFLFRSWLPTSGFVQSTLPTFEMYHNNPVKSGMQYWDMDCILPIERPKIAESR